MKKNILIVGGSSGVGLELARHYISDGHTVCITGRKNPELKHAQYERLDITANADQLGQDIDTLLNRFSGINTLIYCAGFRQRALIDALNDAAIKQMINVGLLAPTLLVQRLKNQLDIPLKIMLITSSSQYTAREQEPVYCAVKSGIGMLGASMAFNLEESLVKLFTHH